MATQNDVRACALSLPGTGEAEDTFAFNVINKGKPRGFVWAWNQRIAPKKPRVPNPEVLVVRVATLIEKDLLLQEDPTLFFTDAHYDGYPAVLVRLALIELDHLRALVTDAWRTLAPVDLQRELDGPR